MRRSQQRQNFLISCTFLPHLYPIRATENGCRLQERGGGAGRIECGDRHFENERSYEMTGSVSGVGGGMSASALKQMQEEMFKRADRNNDGSISKDELSQVAKSGDNQQGGPSVDEMFSQLDSDGDGAVSRLESDAAIAKAGQQMQSQGMRPSGPPPGPRRPRKANRRLIRPRAMPTRSSMPWTPTRMERSARQNWRQRSIMRRRRVRPQPRHPPTRNR